MIIIISLPIRLYSKFHTFCTIGIHDMHKSRRRRTKERTYGIFKCIYYATSKIDRTITTNILAKA